jgi:uncharacterized protein YqfA (UPF0365 family)
MTTPDPATAPELQQEIERTRERLGQTVEQLAAKADVKAQARAKAADVKAQARAKAAEMKARAAEMPAQLTRNEMVQRNWPLALTAAGILLMGAALAWRGWKT